VAVAVLVLVCTLVLKQASLDDLTEAWKCPACFGSDFCLTISSGDVRLRPFISWINAKNVYFGRWEGRPVALKKLGHDWELNELDVRLCNLMGQVYKNYNYRHIGSNIFVLCQLKLMRLVFFQIKIRIFFYVTDIRD